MTPTTADAGTARTGAPFTVTATVCGAAVLPNWSVAFATIESDTPLPTVSASVPSAAVICPRVPLIVRLVVLLPLTPAPLAVRMPVVSFRVIVNVSVPGALSSDRPMPPIAPVLPMPTVAPPAGVPITGPFSTVTPIVCAAAAFPRLSVAVSAMLSSATVLSVSLSVPSCALTCAKLPLIVRLAVPCPPTPTLLPTDSRPCVSASVTVKLSPLVVPPSDRLTPVIATGLPTPAVTAPGTDSTGSAFTVIPTLVGETAALPNWSVAVTTMVSAAITELVSVSVVSALSTCVKVPLTVTVLPPPPETVAPNALPIDNSPLVSASVTVSPSEPSAFGSLTEMKLIAWGVPTPTMTDAGALTTGSPVTVTPIVCVPAVKANWSDAFTTIGSEPGVPPVSVRLARVAFTSAKLPLMVRALVPDPVMVGTPLAVTARWPVPSARVTVNGLVEAAPLSATLTPVIAAALPVPTNSAVGTVRTGPFTTVTAIVCGVAVLPRLSVVVIPIESAPSVGSFTLRLATAWFT